MLQVFLVGVFSFFGFCGYIGVRLLLYAIKHPAPLCVLVAFFFTGLAVWGAILCAVAIYYSIKEAL